MSRFRLGDKVKCRGWGGLWHYGTFVGWDPSNFAEMFVHNAKGKGVVLTDEGGFAEGETVFVVSHAARGDELATCERAFAELGRPYRLLTDNCEHHADRAAGGPGVSPTVGKAVVGTAFAALAVWGIKTLIHETKWDAGVGRYRDGNGRFIR
ncbi:MAG: hypothetical protein ACOZNI_19795 [Myxococcota bacterium]